MPEAISPFDPSRRSIELASSETAEEIDYSALPPEQVSAAFLTMLPEREHGYQLAGSIKEAMGETVMPNISTLTGRIRALVQSVDMDTVDQKEAHDIVLHMIYKIIKETAGKKDLYEQRRAAFILAELRAALDKDQTKDDKLWLNVLQRLFS